MKQLLNLALSMLAPPSSMASHAGNCSTTIQVAPVVLGTVGGQWRASRLVLQSSICNAVDIGGFCLWLECPIVPSSR